MNKSNNILAVVMGIAISLCSGFAFAAEEHIWIGINENGDKPGTGFLLNEQNGKVTSGKTYILDPNNPSDFSKGKAYELKNMRHENNIVECDVTYDYKDDNSTTKTVTFHFRITLKSAFAEAKVEATFYSTIPESKSTPDEEKSENRSIIFEKKTKK